MLRERFCSRERRLVCFCLVDLLLFVYRALYLYERNLEENGTGICSVGRRLGTLFLFGLGLLVSRPF